MIHIDTLLHTFGCEIDPTSPQPPATFEGLLPLDKATPRHLSFLAADKYLEEARHTQAGALLVSAKGAEALQGQLPNTTLLICKDPYAAFARVALHLHKPQHPFSGVSPMAHVDSSAHIDSTATIFPFAFVGPGAHIGPHTVVYSGVFIGAASRIGANCILYPNCVVREGCLLGDRVILNPGAVLGGDGFGFAPSGMENIKIPQVGGVVVADDVEVGSNSSIDRGAMGNTSIAKQTKIDSLVQVGHNVTIGEASFICAQVGIAGSTKIGKRVTLAGQVGVGGHIEVGDFTTATGQTGITKSVPGNETYGGTPARPNREYLQQLAIVSRLAKDRKKKNPT